METPKEPDQPVWLHAWQQLLAADPRNAETRTSEAYRYTRAIVTAHPEWGNANVGRALGYDTDLCKKRGSYWRGRLASLGDLPGGAAFSVQHVSPDLRVQLEEDPEAAEVWAHHNSGKLPPIPPELLAALQRTDDPEEVYSLLRQHRRQLELAHRDTPVSTPKRAASPTRSGQRVKRTTPPASSMPWRPILLVGSGLLGALAVVVLFTRSHAGE